MWTAEDIHAKQGLIQSKAYQHWRPYAWTLDRTFLADLAQEAWTVALTYAPAEPLLAVKIDDALRAYLRYWRLGLRSLGSTTAPRAIYQPVPMTRQVVKARLHARAPIGPERTAMLRQGLRRIWQQCSERQRRVWIAQLLEGSLSLKRRDTRRMGLSDSQVSRARKSLQRLAVEVLTREPHMAYTEVDRSCDR